MRSRSLQSGSLLLGARSLEDVPHRVVAFVTSVFIDGSRGLRQGRLSLPSFRKCRGIVDRKFVENRVGIETREALDQVQILVGAAEVSLVREVGRVDHQRIAFPTAARISQPLADVLWKTPGCHFYFS